jgi:hypothetical protein
MQAGAARQNEYSFTDAGAPQQVSYYRLKQVDSKQAMYSSVVTVNNVNSRLSLEYYPNPATDKLLVQLQSPDRGVLHIRLRSLDGKLLTEEQLMKSQEVLNSNVNVQNLKQGLYFMEIELGSWREVRMIVKK